MSRGASPKGYGGSPTRLSNSPITRIGSKALPSAPPTPQTQHPDEGFIYVLTNEGMPGWVKIGLTRSDDITDRLKQLYTTGVIFPFEIEYAARVPDCGHLEKVLHRVFGEKRARTGREFFQADPALVKLIIDLVKIADRPVSDAEQGITPDQRENIEAEKSRRSPKIDFERLGLPVGAELTLTKDPSITCLVSSKNKVSFKGEEMSPSQAALRAINGLGFKWRAVSGSEYWAYEGLKLSALVPAADKLAEAEEVDA
jgi:hypothetical protein